MVNIKENSRTNCPKCGKRKNGRYLGYCPECTYPAEDQNKLNGGIKMENEELKKKIIEKISKKYKINSYRKVVENIVDMAIEEVNLGGK